MIAEKTNCLKHFDPGEEATGTGGTPIMMNPEMNFRHLELLFITTWYYEHGREDLRLVGQLVAERYPGSPAELNWRVDEVDCQMADDAFPEVGFDLVSERFRPVIRPLFDVISKTEQVVSTFHH
jgi:hypothetical protein